MKSINKSEKKPPRPLSDKVAVVSIIILTLMFIFGRGIWFRISPGKNIRYTIENHDLIGEDQIDEFLKYSAGDKLSIITIKNTAKDTATNPLFTFKIPGEIQKHKLIETSEKVTDFSFEIPEENNYILKVDTKRLASESYFKFYVVFMIFEEDKEIEITMSSDNFFEVKPLISYCSYFSNPYKISTIILILLLTYILIRPYLIAKANQHKKIQSDDDVPTFHPYGRFKYCNIDWEVIHGVWKLYDDKLVGYNNENALIVNKELSEYNFRIEILFSVDSIVDEINIQVWNNELRIDKDGTGFTKPEKKIKKENFSTIYRILKNRKHKLLLDKSNDALVITLDESLIKHYKLDAVEEERKRWFGIRTWKGTLTIYDIKSKVGSTPGARVLSD